MTIFFLYCIKKMSFSGSPKGTPPTTGVVELWKKKLFCNENQWNWVVFLKKMMNIFTWDLYSMYVVLQGIGVSFMYKSIYHLCNSPWGVATLDVWSSSTRTFQQKNQVTRNDQFLFILY